MNLPINKILVVAGNYDQFKTFLTRIAESIKGENIPFVRTDWIYVDHVNKILGLRDVWGYKVGTWRERKDLNDIATVVMTSGSSFENDFIEVSI